MPRVRVKVKPTYEKLAGFSTEFPDDEFRILAAHPTEDGLLVVLEAETADPAAIVRYFDTIPEVLSSEVLHMDEQTVLVHYVIPEPEPYRAAQTSGNLPKYPLILRDGWIFTDFTTSQERLSQFKRELEAAGVTYHILSITNSHDSTEFLTDRQRQFLSEAVERGYYDTPRRCSLTDLAVALEVSKATASGILHRAEGTIIKQFVGEPAV